MAASLTNVLPDSIPDRVNGVNANSKRHVTIMIGYSALILFSMRKWYPVVDIFFVWISIFHGKSTSFWYDRNRREEGSAGEGRYETVTYLTMIKVSYLRPKTEVVCQDHFWSYMIEIEHFLLV